MGYGNKRLNTKKPIHPDDNKKPKSVSRRYIVTPQTAYHITELALMEKTTEGHIIDKIIRNYLNSLKYQSR